MSMPLGCLHVIRIAELHPWRCHVPGRGLGTVLARETVSAREMAAAEILYYRVRLDVVDIECWVERDRVHRVEPHVVAFPRARPEWLS